MGMIMGLGLYDMPGMGSLLAVIVRGMLLSGVISDFWCFFVYGIMRACFINKFWI